MTKILATLLLVGALSGVAVAEETSISTATYGGVSVSTSAPTRVDNINSGGTSKVLVGRSVLKIVNPVGNPVIYCGYNSSVSTISTSGYFGEPVVAGEKLVLALSTALQYWCKSETVATAPRIQVQQAGKKPAPGR